MELLLPAAGSALGFAGGWAATGGQHLLYREPQFRANPMAGRKRLLVRLGGALACAIIAAIAFRPGHHDWLPAALTAFFGAILVVLACTDIERRRVPDRLSYPAMALAAAFCWAWPERPVDEIALGTAVAAGVALLIFAAGLLVGGGMGLGDAKLMLLIGLLTGWPLVFSAIFFGVFLGGLPALGLMLAGKRRVHFAYGPYLAAGAIISMLWPTGF